MKLCFKMKQNLFIKYSKKGVLFTQSATDNIDINIHNEQNSCQRNEPHYHINNHISHQRKDNNDIMLYPFVIDHLEKTNCFENIKQPFIDADKNNDKNQKQELDIPRPRSFDFTTIFFNKKRKFVKKTSQSSTDLVPILNKPEEASNKSNTTLNQSSSTSCIEKNTSKNYISYFYKENGHLKETKHVNSEEGLRGIKHDLKKEEMKQQQSHSKIIISHPNHTTCKFSSKESLSFTTSITPKEAAKQYRQNHFSNRNNIVTKKKKKRNCKVQTKKNKNLSPQINKQKVRKINCEPVIHDLPELC